MGYFDNRLALKMRIENISAAKVADRAGLHENTVDRMRRNHKPNIETLAKIVTAMGWHGEDVLVWVDGEREE